VILEEAPVAVARSAVVVNGGSGSSVAGAGRLEALPLLVSARTVPALVATAARLRDFWSERPELSPLDVAYSLAIGRARLKRRSVLLGTDRDELLAGLDALAASDTHPGLLTGSARPGLTAFLFTGTTAATAAPGATSTLRSAFPAFAKALDEDPAALEAAIVTLLASWGVRADMFLAEAAGEAAAKAGAGEQVPVLSARLDAIELAHRLRVDGVRQVLTLGGESALAGALAGLRETDGDGGGPRIIVPRVGAGEEGEVRSLLGAVAELDVQGVRVDWGAIFAGTGAEQVTLPSYPFQHRRYWRNGVAAHESAASAPATTGSAADFAGAERGS
jgi:acyl transferase domain-containing protein